MSRPLRRITVVTDAWRPQVNGVVRTYTEIAGHMAALGCEMNFLTPQRFATIAAPSYPEIRLALSPPGTVGRALEQRSPDFVHIATEGPLGLAARRHCRKQGRAFTTSYHTRFPEYVAARFPIPEGWVYAYLRRFHRASAGVMVASPTLAEELSQRDFDNLMVWSRGVDTGLFRPRRVRVFGDAGPVMIYVGRVAVEKNLEAFLDLPVQGRKVVVGDGPALMSLRRRYHDVVFTGAKSGDELAACYASGDVFVFPSRTDTFGVVLLEAMASGLPVAAYPVTGPKDLVVDGVTGALEDDLAVAVLRALKLDRVNARAHAEKFCWQACAELFVANILEANMVSGAPARVGPGETAPSETGVKSPPERAEFMQKKQARRRGGAGLVQIEQLALGGNASLGERLLDT